MLSVSPGVLAVKLRITPTVLLQLGGQILVVRNGPTAVRSDSFKPGFTERSSSNRAPSVYVGKRTNSPSKHHKERMNEDDTARDEMTYWRDRDRRVPDNVPEPSPNEESVWSYPHRPKVKAANDSVTVIFDETTIAESDDALKVLEKSQPPSYYIPAEDVRTGLLRESQAEQTLCEWKGNATYYDIKTETGTAEEAAWTYPKPLEDYRELGKHYSFYPQKVQACYVGDQKVLTQEGKYYGGWVTPDILGPFKTRPRTK